MRTFLAVFMLTTGYLVGSSAIAAEIPADCATQAPWGAPIYQGAEPPLTPLCRTAYVSLHDDQKLVPDFVSWQLTAQHALGCLARNDAFTPDPNLPVGHRAELVDYRGQTGVYDRGHFAPNSDFEWDVAVERESFYLSNMSPQSSHLNQWEWEQLEAATRAWTMTRPTLIVMDGPIWQETPATIGPDNVAVPSAYWKVIIDPATNDSLAFIMKNEPTPKGDLAPYAVPIAEVETEAGFTLPLPTGVNRTQTAQPWPADLGGFTKKKKQTCAVN